MSVISTSGLIGVLDVSGGVGRGIAGVVLDPKRRTVWADPAKRNHLRIQHAVKGGGKRRDLSAVRIASRGRCR